MASPAKITEALPDTLPEDFNEWDGEESRWTQLVHPASPESGSGLGVVPKPTVRPAELHGAVTSSRNLLRGAVSSISAAEYADDAAFLHRIRALGRSGETGSQRQAIAPAIDEVRFSAPGPTAAAAAAALKATPTPQDAAMAEADEILFQSFRTNTAETVEAQSTKKKWLIIAGASAALVTILATAMILVFNQSRASSVKPIAAPTPTVTLIQRPEDAALKPPVSILAVPQPTRPTVADSEAQNSSKAAQASSQKNAGPTQAPAQMMNAQLDAPARIHMAAAPAEQAPPPSGGFAVADMDGSDNNSAIGNVFGSAKQQAVLPKIINVSSGVAFGLLIQRTPPVYPPIAKTARVSGTVVLAAIISNNGTVENLRVVSGPAMLRGAALDAVRTWRYKPYQLNNQPTAIETMINVNFSLAN